MSDYLKKDPTWNRVQQTSYHLGQASQYAYGALALYGAADRHLPQYERWAFEHLEKAAEALGYTLVKREREAA